LAAFFPIFAAMVEAKVMDFLFCIFGTRRPIDWRRLAPIKVELFNLSAVYMASDGKPNLFKSNSLEWISPIQWFLSL
jgi:hypothetical protein